MKTRVLIGFILGIAMTGLSGCALLVAGGAGAAGTYAYVSGWLERDYQAGFEEVYQATEQAVDQLGMTVTSETKELGEASIDAKKGEENFFINIKLKGDNLTTVSVKRGVLGNEEASRRVHEAIDQNL